MKLHRHVIFGLISLLIFTGCFSVSADDTGDNRAQEWKIGDSWAIDTTLYSRDWILSFSDPKMEAEKNNPKVLASYVVKVQVTGQAVIDGTKCWEVDFEADESAPKGVREQKYRISVSQEDKSIKKITRLEGKNLGNPTIERVGNIVILKDAPYGFPIETIPLEMENESGGARKGSVLSASRTEKHVEGKKEMDMSLSLKKDEREIMRVRQKWSHGAKWWAEYEKYTRGHKEIHAQVREKHT